jgi:hypothetical protein
VGRTTWIYARAGRLAAVDAGAALAGAAVLVALRLVPQLLSPLAFWLLLGVVWAGFAADFLVRWLRGVRALCVEGETLLLLAGARRTMRRIPRQQVSRVRVRRRWGGKRLEVHLHGRRRPLAISDDAFVRSDFDRLTTLLAAWS